MFCSRQKALCETLNKYHRYFVCNVCVSILTFFDITAACAKEKKVPIEQSDREVVAAESIALDPDVLRDTLERNCHPLTNVSTGNHSVSHESSIILGGDSLFHAVDSAAAGSINTRLIGLSTDSVGVTIHLLDMDDKSRLDYTLTSPFTVTFNATYRNVALTGENVSNFNTLRINNNGVAKSYANGAMGRALADGMRIDFICSGDMRYFNIFVAQQLHLNLRKAFFVTPNNENITTTVTVGG